MRNDLEGVFMDPMYQVSVTFCMCQTAMIFEQVDVTFEVQGVTTI